MDQEKVGKFIAQRRKELKLTQEEIAEKLGITSQSVSKWERGVNSPDISLLIEISRILNVSIEELLAGQLSENKEKQITGREEIIIDTIKHYTNKTRKKYLNITKIIIVAFLLSIISFLGLYYINNYNKIRIYSIHSQSEDIQINGKIIFNPQNNLIIINDIEYNDKYTGTDKELIGKKTMFSLETNEKILIEYGNLDNEKTTKSKNINELLDEIFVSKIVTSGQNIILENRDMDNLKLIITYIDSTGEIKKIKTNIKTEEEFSNNDILYD